MDGELRFRAQQGMPQDPHNDADFHHHHHHHQHYHHHQQPPQFGGPFGQDYPGQQYGPQSGAPPGYGQDPNMNYNPNYGMQYNSGYQPPAQAPPAGYGMGGNNFGNDMMMNFGMQYGSKVLQKTQANFSRYLFWLQGLHYYFTVNNSYVKNKLKLLMFPLRHKYRRREVDAGHRFETPGMAPTTNYNYLTAVDDINAPDMYIPLMAFITYILLVGFITGIGGVNFSPEVLIATGSSSMVLTLTEMLLLRLGFSVLSVPRPVYSLDLLCFISYKFFHVSVILLTRIALLRWMYVCFWVMFAAFHGYFLLHTLKLYWQGSGSQQHMLFLYFVAGVQFPIFFYLQHV
mmetsp:Transcript_22525/g.35759  ORF Transcript_22525/g.35759 Transcript_22525/m.35759 type:complete len:344 (-) Transcript_22525:1444-2475(-)